MAVLATEYGFDPDRILGWDLSLFEAVCLVHEFRVKEAERELRRPD